MRKFMLILNLVLLGLIRTSNAQIIEKDADFQASELMIDQPGFSMHRDNYFISGIPLNKKPSRDNSDVKYQISFKQRLRRTPLPGGVFPYLMYTQKAFWDIYKSSKPFDEINFNPGFALVRPFFLKGHRLSYLSASLEHESNGRDSIYSRSWNFFAVSLRSQWTERLTLGLRFWLPMAYKDDNPDLLTYVGLGELSSSYIIKPDIWSADIILKKGKGWNNKGSMQVQLNWRPCKDENQYLMLQWFQGNGESLIDYKQHTSMLRIGFLLKPNILGVF